MAGQATTKLFYKIGEVSRQAGVEPYILRYWETEFPMLAPRKNQGGQRVYQHKDLEMVLDIKRMLHEEGYTIAGARKKLAEAVKGTGVRKAALHVEKGMGDIPQTDLFETRPGPYDLSSEKDELADALGRFRDEIKGILDLLR